MKFLLTLIAIGLVAPVFATEDSPKATIVKLVSYAKYGNGDIFVKLEATSPICNGGYYINKSSEGFQSVTSMLLAAYHAKLPIIVKADEASKWVGSDTVCEINAVYYQ